jgi:hypothetical protein
MQILDTTNSIINNSTLLFNSTNPNVVSIDSNAHLQVNGVGSTTIQITKPENQYYVQSDLSVNITVDKNTSPMTFSLPLINYLNTPISLTGGTNLYDSTDGNVVYQVTGFFPNNPRFDNTWYQISSDQSSITVYKPTNIDPFSKTTGMQITAIQTGCKNYSDISISLYIQVCPQPYLSFVVPIDFYNSLSNIYQLSKTSSYNLENWVSYLDYTCVINYQIVSGNTYAKIAPDVNGNQYILSAIDNVNGGGPFTIECSTPNAGLNSAVVIDIPNVWFV